MPGLSLFETILVAIFVPPFIARYIGTYTEFRREMIEARKHFRFYSHIYSNFFSIDEISTDRFKEITGIKEIVRIKWADMESKYLLIPNELKWVLIRIKKLPKQHDLELILGTFMAIHHTTIVYHTKESKEESGHTDLVERRKQIEEIQTFLKLYI